MSDKTEVERLREAAGALIRLRQSVECDVSTAHSLRGQGANSEMRSDDRDMRADLSAAFDALAAALASPAPLPSGERNPMTDPDINWLVHQLEAWPSRVDPDKTTNIQYLMSAAAKHIRATPLQGPAPFLSHPTTDNGAS